MATLFPLFLAFMYQIHPGFYSMGNLVPAFTFGMLMHISLDFVYYENHKKEKGVQSSLLEKMPTALAMAIAVLPHIPFLFFGAF